MATVGRDVSTAGKSKLSTGEKLALFGLTACAIGLFVLLVTLATVR